MASFSEDPSLSHPVPHLNAHHFPSSSAAPFDQIFALRFYFPLLKKVYLLIMGVPAAMCRGLSGFSLSTSVSAQTQVASLPDKHLTHCTILMGSRLFLKLKQGRGVTQGPQPRGSLPVQVLALSSSWEEYLGTSSYRAQAYLCLNRQSQQSSTSGCLHTGAGEQR